MNINSNQTDEMETFEEDKKTINTQSHLLW